MLCLSVLLKRCVFHVTWFNLRLNLLPFDFECVAGGLRMNSSSIQIGIFNLALCSSKVAGLIKDGLSREAVLKQRLVPAPGR